MLKKLYIFLFFFLLVLAQNAFSQSDERFNVNVKPLTPAAPNTSDYKVQSKADTSGGIKLSLSGIGVADTAAFWLLYNMKPGDYEKKMGFMFGNIDPCMYRKGISIDKGITNNYLCNNFADLTFNKIEHDGTGFASLNSVINTSLYTKTNFISDILAPQANAQIGVNCEEIYDNFLNGKSTSEEDSQNLDICKYHCRKPAILNDKYKETCGVNECIEKYRNGVIPQWCSFLAENLNPGFGSESPLASIYEKISKKPNRKRFFGTCVDNWINAKDASDECCIYSRKFIQYDEVAGKEFSDFCSVKKSLQICLDEYNVRDTLHPSCCNMADYYGGSLNIPGIKGNLKMETTMGKSINSYCKNYSKENYSYYNNCVAEYNKSAGKTIIEDCCKAYALGILAPSLDGVDYSRIVSFCNPR